MRRFLSFSLICLAGFARCLQAQQTNANQLLDAIQQSAGEKKVRLVLLSPIRHEKMPAPLPDPAKHNEQLAEYSKALQELARQRNAWYVPMLTLLDNRRLSTEPVPMTDNGIHLTDYGYR